MKRVCGTVRVCLALLPHLLAWSQSSPVPLGAASPLSGCVTTRMTVGMAQMRSAHLAAPQTSSDVPAPRGDLDQLNIEIFKYFVEMFFFQSFYEKINVNEF